MKPLATPVSLPTVGERIDWQEAIAQLSLALDSDNAPTTVHDALALMDKLNHWNARLQDMLRNQIICALEP